MKTFYINNRSIIVIIFMISLSSCVVPEDMTENQFWFNIAGKWKLDEVYSINSKQFSFEECDKSLSYNIEPPVDIHADWNRYQSDVYRKWYGDNWDEAFCFINESMCEYADFLPDMDYSYNSFQACDYIQLEFGNTTCNEEHNSLNTIGAVDIKSGCVKIGAFRPYDIVDINSMEIKMISLQNIYNRHINGELIYDTIRIKLVRSNNSSIFIINNFTPDYYQQDFHEKFDDNNSACINDYGKLQWGGIDRKCILFDDGPICLLQSVSDLHELDMRGTPGFSISFWYKEKSLPEYCVLLSKYNGEYGPFILSLESNKMKLQINNGIGELMDTYSEEILRDTFWHHILLSCGNELTKIFYDGTKILDQSLDFAKYDNNAAWSLGMTQFDFNNGISENRFNGYFDEFIAYYDELPEGVVPIMKNYYDTLTYNPLNLFNLTGAFFNYQESYSIIQGEDEVIEFIDDGYIMCGLFDGIKNAFPININYKIPDEDKEMGLISLWMQQSELQFDTQIIYSHIDETLGQAFGTYNLFIYILGHDLMISLRQSGNYKTYKVDNFINSNEWIWLAFTITKNELILYKNGIIASIYAIDVERTYISGNELLGNSIISMSRLSGDYDGFKGKIDEVWSSGFSENESKITHKEIYKIFQWYHNSGYFN